MNIKEDIEQILSSDPDFALWLDRLFEEGRRRMEEDAEIRHQQKRDYWQTKTEGSDPF